MNQDIKNLTLESFDAATAKGTTLVDFHASWCGPCKALAPTLDALAGEFAQRGASIVKIDVDAEQELAARFGVSSIPTLLVLQEGREVRRQVGAPRPAELRALVGQDQPI